MGLGGGLKPDQIASKPDQIDYSPFLVLGLYWLAWQTDLRENAWSDIWQEIHSLCDMHDIAIECNR